MYPKNQGLKIRLALFAISRPTSRDCARQVHWQAHVLSLVRTSVSIAPRLLSAGTTIGRGLLLLAAVTALAGGYARAANPRYSPPQPIFVKLVFEGDPNFPSLTSNQRTDGLGRFTGANFGITTLAQRNDLIGRIQAILGNKYKGYNIKFVTGTPPVANFYTWGIDDGTIVSHDCNGPSVIGRIFGMAGSKVDTTNVCDGSSIFFPRHARTWAGSFTRPSGAWSPSDPALILGNRMNGTRITLEHIAQALGNSAAHEISHMFGTLDVGCGRTDDSCRATRLMRASKESLEATNDKVFVVSEKRILRKAIGRRAQYLTTVPGAAIDDKTQLMWARNGRLARTIQVGNIDPDSYGRLSYTDAITYAHDLDYLGYDDWRLPWALDANGEGPCAGLLCNGSEFGHRALDQILFPPFASADVGIYWSTSRLPEILVDPWTFTLGTGQQRQASAIPLTVAHVWPVRGSGRLVDNGDGTITDPARQLMWLRDPGQFQPANFQTARRLAADLRFAGYGNWRLPSSDNVSDHTCADPRVFSPNGPSSPGCRQNELGHLFHGWGISAASPAPFALPTDVLPMWIDDGNNGAQEQNLSYSFADGVMSRGDRTARQLVFPVRDIRLGEFSRGQRVLVEPEPSILIRFTNVTARGLVTVQRLANGTFGEPAYRMTTQGTFESAVVCIRYDDRGALGSFESRLRIRQGPNEMALVAGYPDTTNNVICGSGSGAQLGDFRLFISN
jgi:hypothetical protein